VHVADALEHERTEPFGSGTGVSPVRSGSPTETNGRDARATRPAPDAEIDTDYLASLGLAERIDAWRENSEAVTS